MAACVLGLAEKKGSHTKGLQPLQELSLSLGVSNSETKFI